MTNDINIRHADINDSSGIAEVHVRSWQVAYRGILPDELLDGLSIEKRVVAWRKGFEMPDNGVAIVAETSEAKIVGWAHFAKTRDEDKVNSRTGEITGIYILSEYWRKGIGKQLFAYALAELRKQFDEVTIWVLRQNKRAIGFYEKMRFRPDGKEKREQRKNAIFDAVRFCRNLKG